MSVLIRNQETTVVRTSFFGNKNEIYVVNKNDFVTILIFSIPYDKFYFIDIKLNYNNRIINFWHKMF